GLEPPVGISKWLQVTADGRGTVVPPEAAAAVFFHEADAVDAMEAARRLRPQLEAARLMAPIWTADRFGSLPRLYIEALRDRSVPLAAQREMQRLVPGATVVSLDTDHAPQLSARTELARALVEWCSAVLPAATVSVGSR
ncbi:MAG: alpha/beta fold hydrolase, partial [Rhodococcus sp. (in: high G+C Gram-positive bacteria)]|uniref:alpha/beta fold hydrolase n=2 Tax=Rhodococcus TaxID=1827 RepID=UPI003D9B7FE1